MIRLICKVMLLPDVVKLKSVTSANGTLPPSHESRKAHEENRDPWCPGDLVAISLAWLI
jgi:hypothetical protein